MYRMLLVLLIMTGGVDAGDGVNPELESLSNGDMGCYSQYSFREFKKIKNLILEDKYQKQVNGVTFILAIYKNPFDNVSDVFRIMDNPRHGTLFYCRIAMGR